MNQPTRVRAINRVLHSKGFDDIDIDGWWNGPALPGMVVTPRRAWRRGDFDRVEQAARLAWPVQ